MAVLLPEGHRVAWSFGPAQAVAAESPPADGGSSDPGQRLGPCCTPL